MGKQKYLDKINELFKKSPIVDFASISRIIREHKDVKQYSKQAIRALIATGKIKKLTKGKYTLYDDPSLAVFGFKPAYLGLQDALSLHNLWEQETIPVIISSRKVRQGVRNILGTNVLIRRIDKKYLFGFDLVNKQFYLPYSDIEKTLIDFVYFKEHLDDETIKKIKEKLNKNKLNSYLKLYPKKIRNRVLTVLSQP